MGSSPHPSDRLRLAMLCVGDELLDGRIADLNAQHLGAYGARVGWPLAEVRFADDDPVRIADHVRSMTETPTVLVVSGGLGPTSDDRTREAVAAAVGVPLAEDADARERLLARFRAWGVKMADTNLRQAAFPAGARVHPSEHGTADAFIVTRGASHIVCLPGVPREFNALSAELLPEFGCEAAPRVRAFLTVMGIGESNVAERVESLTLPESVSLSYLASWPIVRIGVSAPEGEGDAVRDALDAIADRLASHRTPGDALTLPDALGAVLRAQGATIATAESCTGGLIASQITDTPGASSYFQRGWVVYANAAKTDALGVPAEHFDAYGAVSGEVAAAMAHGARTRADADVAVAVSGIAGPGGGTPEKPVGLVFLAVATRNGGVVVKAHFQRTDRKRFKRSTAALAHILVMRALQPGADALGFVRGVEWVHPIDAYLTPASA